MTWHVSIDGHRRDLERLADTFDDNPRVVQREEYEDKFFLEAEELNTLSDVSQVRRQARELLQAISGIVEFRYGLLEEFRVAGIYKEGADGTAVFDEAGPTHAYASPGLREALGLPEPDRDADKELLSLANDEDVLDLLLLWERGRGWMNLYKIFEYIEDQIGEKLHEVGWVSEDDRKNFRRTANDKRIIGLDARHGTATNRSSPPQPMSHDDAVELVQSLTSRWIAERAAEQEEE